MDTQFPCPLHINAQLSRVKSQKNAECPCCCTTFYRFAPEVAPEICEGCDGEALQVDDERCITICKCWWMAALKCLVGILDSEDEMCFEKDDSVHCAKKPELAI